MSRKANTSQRNYNIVPLNALQKAINVLIKEYTNNAVQSYKKVLDKIRNSLLLKIHIQVIMLQAKNLQLFLYCLLYL